MRLLFLLSLALPCFAAPAENVFRNGPADQRTSSFFRLASVNNGVSQEWGDEVVLAGTGRTITEMTVYTFGDFAAPTGNEKIRIRFYHQNGSFVGTPGKQAPNTLIWDSGFVPMKPGWRAQRIPVPSIVVPDRFTWTASFEGVTGLPLNRSGLSYFGPPTVGTSENWLWRRSNNNSPWSYQVSDWSNGSSAYGSLGVSFWADGPPTPIVFDTTTAATREFRFAPLVETGDDVVFEGEDRFFSTVSVEYVSDVTAPGGDERARLRIYDRIANDPFGLPGNPLFDSGLLPIDAAAGSHLFTAFPEMELPDDIIWTIEFAGVSQQPGDELSIHARTDPNPGASVPTFWAKESGVFSAYWFGDPTYDPTTWPSTAESFNHIIANFSAKFVADGPPTIIEHNSPPNLGPGISFTGVSENLLASDDVRWHLRPGVVFSTSLPPIALTMTHTLPQATASWIRFTLESRGTAGTIRQEIQVWNFVQQAWVTIEHLSSIAFGSAPDLVRTVDLGDPAALIGPANEVIVRVRWRSSGPVFAYPWNVGLDRAYVSFRP